MRIMFVCTESVEIENIVWNTWKYDVLQVKLTEINREYKNKIYDQNRTINERDAENYMHHVNTNWALNSVLDGMKEIKWYAIPFDMRKKEIHNTPWEHRYTYNS